MIFCHGEKWWVSVHYRHVWIDCNAKHSCQHVIDWIPNVWWWVTCHSLPPYQLPLVLNAQILIRDNWQHQHQQSHVRCQHCLHNTLGCQISQSLINNTDQGFEIRRDSQQYAHPLTSTRIEGGGTGSGVLDNLDLVWLDFIPNLTL